MWLCSWKINSNALNFQKGVNGWLSSTTRDDLLQKWTHKDRPTLSSEIMHAHLFHLFECFLERYAMYFNFNTTFSRSSILLLTAAYDQRPLIHDLTAFGIASCSCMPTTIEFKRDLKRKRIINNGRHKPRLWTYIIVEKKKKIHDFGNFFLFINKL